MDTTQCSHVLCEGLTFCLASTSEFLKMCWRHNVFNLEAQEQVMPCGDKFSPMREAEGCILPLFFSRKIVQRSSHWYSPWKDRPTCFSLVWNHTLILPYYFSLGGIFKTNSTQSLCLRFCCLGPKSCASSWKDNVRQRCKTKTIKGPGGIKEKMIQSHWDD